MNLYDTVLNLNKDGNFNPHLLAAKFRQSDLTVAILIIGIIIVLIMPIPAFMMDYLLAGSLIFSVVILMTSLFISSALEFTAFPFILLVAAMLRLALNIATTRLILSEGHMGTDAAGRVIEAFGHFIMQGNYVIGIIVFTILVIVNFVVITKGSGRIAEVAARFSLDAMPGKQMAIDADLAAGIINEESAQKRRKNLEEETAFFGAMDGASKFVRGDAIAGILITFINIIGGIVIGITQKGMDISGAMQNYTLLTIGDGLISQIPSLIVSISAGMIVSKAGVDKTANKALLQQLTSYPKTFFMTALLIFLMAFLPGIPAMPFLFFALCTGFIATYFYVKEQEKEKRLTEQTMAEEKSPDETPLKEVLMMDEIRLEIGYALLPFINGDEGDLLSQQIKNIRNQFAKNMGFITPSIRIIDNLKMDKNQYQIKVREIDAGTGTVYPDMDMVMSPNGTEITLPGIRTKDPVFGVPTTWIEKNISEEATQAGYTVVDGISVLSTHISEIIKTYMSDLLSYAETVKLLDNIGEGHKQLVSDLIPDKITVTTLKCILQKLLKEQISIRNLPVILEAIAEIVDITKNPDQLTEHTRTRLAWQISTSHLNEQGILPLLPISPEWDNIFMKNISGEGQDTHIALPPSQLQEFINKLKTAFEKATREGESPILLTNALLRPHIRSIVERFSPHIFVMSQNEVHNRIKLKTVGSI